MVKLCDGTSRLVNYAVIVKCVGTGSRRFYVTFPSKEGATEELTVNTSITFSPQAWQGSEELPEVGQVVQLHDIQKYAKGWRARVVRAV